MKTRALSEENLSQYQVYKFSEISVKLKGSGTEAATGRLWEVAINPTLYYLSLIKNLAVMGQNDGLALLLD